MITSTDRPVPAGSLEVDAGDHYPSEKPEVLSAELSADELLLQLGHEYFSLQSEQIQETTPAPTSASSSPHVDPHALANGSPEFSPERDFWQDVATTSERLASLPVNTFGAPADPVATAIATVSATYTLPVSDKRLAATSPAGPHSPPGRPTLAQPKETRPSESSPGVSHEKNEQTDFFDVILSLLDLEGAVGSSGAAQTSPEVYTQARELAAFALLAAETNRNSALKAAEGKRG